MATTVEEAISKFGKKAKEKLANPSTSGRPEDQLRSPFEQLLGDVADLVGLSSSDVVAVDESPLADLKTRPDYSVTVKKALVGFVELKAPGKGADPRKFKDKHDREQWDKLRSLPNLLYTDGNSFSLWRNGELIGPIINLDGDVEGSGAKLKATAGLLPLFETFLRWNPVPPKSAKELAETTARLCRLLRDEVTEQLKLKTPALTSLAQDWRKLLFPDATDARFADGYAQAVTFGMLMARARNIELASGLDEVAKELSETSSLIGAALRLLTDNTDTRKVLRTGLETLIRVLDVVDWKKISKGKPDTWLYFYEDFLAVYDNDLRKQTGSYYTPPEVVGAMVRLVDEVLTSPRFALHKGLASSTVTIADPATGTGTFLLGILRKIADTVSKDEGAGAIKGEILAALNRILAFEMQLGPFAVAQLRILAEVVDLTGKTPSLSPRMFVTNTLGNPYDDEGWIPSFAQAIGESRKEANKIKREEPITVVIGNPPYKEKAKGLGGWVESGAKNSPDKAPLLAWMPPADWGVSAHAKHLRNLYIYFWRWATWKVYDHGPGPRSGLVCFITVAGFLNGPGFQRMREYLRRTCDDIWVIDCSPEGHQPEVNTRIFQGVQQPVCIVMASRSSNGKHSDDTPAQVLFSALPIGHRAGKFETLAKLSVKGTKWIECPSDWRSPFLPSSKGAWAAYPALEDLFVYNGSGVMPGRTWIISPDVWSLEKRWKELVETKDDLKREEKFHPHLNGEEVGDHHSRKVFKHGLPGFEPRSVSVADDKVVFGEDEWTANPCLTPVRYGYRSFDRQWIIPDNRLINRPNPELWERRSDRQVHLTVLTRTAPSSGPSATVTELIPDLDHYKGSFGGRVFPLWATANASQSNFRPNLSGVLGKKYAVEVSPEPLFCYLAALLASSAFTARFRKDLSTPGLRVPITASRALFDEAASLGKQVIWLHTFGERMVNAKEGRPAGPPRLPEDARPHVPKDGDIPDDVAGFPDTIDYDAGKHRLLIGQGHIDNVTPAMWAYKVSGKQVLTQWFSYRRKNRERPIIGDRRPPSPLGDIQPDHWLPEYTSELLNVLNVLGLLIQLEPKQAELLEKICSGPLISNAELEAAGAFALPAKPKKTTKKKVGTVHMFDENAD